MILTVYIFITRLQERLLNLSNYSITLVTRLIDMERKRKELSFTHREGTKVVERLII